jgi:PAS domain-containing protein
MPFAPLPASAQEPGPIIRVLRSTMSSDDYHSFEPAFDTYVSRVADRWSSNFALWWGTARHRRRIEVAVVSGWEGLPALRRARAGIRKASLRDDSVTAFERDGAGETWQLVDQTATSFEPAGGRVLRLLRLPLLPEADGAFVDFWSPLRTGFVETGDLAVSQLARRGGPEGPTLLLVNVWRDSAALGRVSPQQPYFGQRLPPGLIRGPIRVDTFDLHPTSVLRLAPDGPAILITDDDGRVVDVTPSATALLGASAWDLLDQRLDDLVLVDGDVAVRSLAGRYRFRRPEGGSILLQARSAAHVPAPGRNAVLLLPGSQPTPVDGDLERAIAAAYRRDAPSVGPTGPEPALPAKVAAGPDTEEVAGPIRV